MIFLIRGILGGYAHTVICSGGKERGNLKLPWRDVVHLAKTSRGINFMFV